MKKNFLILLMAASLVGAQHCSAETLKELKAKLQQLAKPILFGKKPVAGKQDNTILLRKFTLEDRDKLVKFLNADVMKFIGSDNSKRKGYAATIINDINALSQGIYSVFNKLVVFWQQSEFGAVEAPLSQKEMTERKDKRLKASKNLETIDPKQLSWGRSIVPAKDGSSSSHTSIVMSVDQVTRNISAALEKSRADVDTVADFYKNEKSSCFGQDCKDRFDLLIFVNAILQALIVKIDASIENLQAAESNEMSRQSGGFYISR